MTKCQQCRNWRPVTTREHVRGYGLCAARPPRQDGTAEMLFMAAWNDACPLQKFVPIVAVREVAPS